MYLDRPATAVPFAATQPHPANVPAALLAERSTEGLKDISEVESVVVKLASFSSSIHSAIDRLTERATAVLRCEPQAAEGGDKIGSLPSSVPLVVDLQQVADKLQTALYRLQSLETRIEL